MSSHRAVVGLHHAGLVVPDIEVAIAFYTKALGLELLHRGSWEAPSPVIDRIIGCCGSAASVAVLSAGFGFLELFQYRAPAQPAQELSEAYRLGVRHICFEVEDPDRTLEAVVDQGGSMMNAPESVPGGGRAVYCRDPFGNLLEFTTSGGRMPSVSDATP